MDGRVGGGRDDMDVVKYSVGREVLMHIAISISRE